MEAAADVGDGRVRRRLALRSCTRDDYLRENVGSQVPR